MLAAVSGVAYYMPIAIAGLIVFIAFTEFIGVPYCEFIYVVSLTGSLRNCLE